MIDYIKNYWTAYREMREAAIEKIKNYGKTLDVVEVCKQRIMEHIGYKSEDEISEDELDDYMCVYTYSCVIRTKHEQLYPCTVLKVRYDKNKNDVEVFLESDDGYVSGWFSIDWIDFNEQDVYMTIHDFIVPD